MTNTIIMNATNTPLSAIDRYAQLKQEIARLEDEVSAIKPAVISYMQEGNIDEIGHSAGTFTLQARRTWTYPASITELDAKLKEKKEIAEQTGEATYVEKPVLVFKSK